MYASVSRILVLMVFMVLVSPLPSPVLAQSVVSNKRVDLYFGLPHLRVESGVSVGKANNLIFKVCAKSLDANSTVTTRLVAGELGSRATVNVTISDSLDRFGTCRDVKVPWTPSVTGFVNITATLNGNRAVPEGLWFFNNLVVRPVWVSN